MDEDMATVVENTLIELCAELMVAVTELRVEVQKLRESAPTVNLRPVGTPGVFTLVRAAPYSLRSPSPSRLRRNGPGRRKTNPGPRVVSE